MRVVLGVLFLVACDSSHVTTEVPDADESRDAGADAYESRDANLPDAAEFDAAAPRLDPTRPQGARTLHPICGTWVYDLDESTTYDSRAELAVAILDAQCKWALRCGVSSGYCDPLRDSPPGQYLADVDVALAHSCLAAIEAASCEAGASPVICFGLERRASAPIGAPCGREGGCDFDSVCSDVSGPCTGTCGPACPPCAADEYCARPGGCQPLPGPGEQCALGAECAEGNWCEPVNGGCMPLPHEGEPCASWVNPYFFTPTYVCPTGLVCDDGHLCVPPIVVPVGAACGGARVCEASVDCLGGVCVARPGVGESCPADGGPCAPGLVCNAAGRCSTLVGPGCGCDATTNACPAGFWCEAGRCTSLAVDAPPSCVGLLDCGGYRCSAGRCVIAAFGDLCFTSSTCDEGRCDFGTHTCAPNLPIGAACVPGECATPGTCVLGVCVFASASRCYTPPP